jgi:vitamin B12 transporter
LERTSGISYNVFDLSAVYALNAMEFSIYANNIFNTEYSETSLIPMPKGNLIFGLKYNFR